MSSSIMSTNTASGAASPKGNGDIQVAVEAASAEEEHRRHLFGITLPRYFNRDADRGLVRKLDLYVLYAPRLSAPT